MNHALLLHAFSRFRHLGDDKAHRHRVTRTFANGNAQFFLLQNFFRHLRRFPDDIGDGNIIRAPEISETEIRPEKSHRKNRRRAKRNHPRRHLRQQPRHQRRLRFLRPPFFLFPFHRHRLHGQIRFRRPGHRPRETLRHFERRQKFRNRRVSFLRIATKCRHDRFFQKRRNGRVVTRRRRDLLLNMFQRDGNRRVAIERQPMRQHFIQHNPERINIRLLGNRIPCRLLRRQIMNGTQDRLANRDIGRIDGARDAEIRHLHTARFRQ